MTLHEEIGAFLDLIEAAPTQDTQPLHRLTPEQARAVFEQTSRQMHWTIPDEVSSEDIACDDGQGARLPMRLYRPHGVSGALPVMVYFHGGGYVVGSLDSHDGVCREWSRQVGCAVLAVGYRLAPEHRFPAPLEDGERALAWLQAQGESLELDVGRLVLAGDSAGATVATVLALQIAQAPERLALRPLLQVLCYPVADAARRHESRELFAEGYLLEDDTLEWFYQHYARCPEDREDWRFSPLHATQLQGVAPALIAVAGYDPLLDEGLAYARHLEAAGVAVECHTYGSLTHDFLRMHKLVPEIAGIQAELAQVVRQSLASAGE